MKTIVDNRGSNSNLFSPKKHTTTINLLTSSKQQKHHKYNDSDSSTTDGHLTNITNSTFTSSTNKRFIDVIDTTNNNNNNNNNQNSQLNAQLLDQHNKKLNKQQHDENSHKVDKSFLLKLRRKMHRNTTANVAGTKFDLVRLAVGTMFKIAADETFENCNLIWDDTRVSVETISELKPFQRYNHFPAMSEISRKDALARNVMKMTKVLPTEFDFIPQTWILPNDYSHLCSYALDMKKANRKRTYILKPSNAACGHGIKLYRNVEKIQPNDNYIVQEYISNPYLLDGYKFDLRIYVLVTSCDPLRAFIFNEGLVRLSTEPYEEPNESNISHLYMHLTNYSLNKHNLQNYQECDKFGEKGSKRSLKYLFEHLKRQDKDVTKLWREIQDVILKTLLVVEPYLFHTYKMCRPGQMPGTDSVCFEVLGFDILLDDTLKPWVLEVNRSPSFGSDQQIDFDIKSRLLIDSFNLIRFRASDRRRSEAFEKSEAQRRLYKTTKNDPVTQSQANGLNIANVKLSKQKKILDLIDQLKQLRREKRKQYYETTNLGNYQRLFPVEDKHKMEGYLNILSTAFNLFYPIGKHCVWKKTYDRIREEVLLDKIAEYDEDNVLFSPHGTSYGDTPPIYKYLNDDESNSDSEMSRSEKDETSDNEYEKTADDRFHYSQQHSVTTTDSQYKIQSNLMSKSENMEPKRTIDIISARTSGSTSRSSQSDIKKNQLISNKRTKHDETESTISHKSKQTTTNRLPNDSAKKRSSRFNSMGSTSRSIISKKVNRSSSTLERSSSSHLYDKLVKNIKYLQQKTAAEEQSNHEKSVVVKSTVSMNTDFEETSNDNAVKLTTAVYKLLVQLDIKFPGRSNKDTKTFLDEIYSQFSLYKQKIASYWMVKLDDHKRQKIIDIVKSNAVVVLQKVYMMESVESLKLYKIFTKLFNRMLWMHGQGLWNCFTNTNDSWEAIFSKSSFNITDTELKCCYRVVELCKDCVIIVYQYALEQKAAVADHQKPPAAPSSLNSTTASKVVASASSQNRSDVSSLLRRKQQNNKIVQNS